MPDPRKERQVLVAAVPLPGDAAQDVASRDLGSRLRVVEKAARAVRRGKDERAVHDLRVASRRLDTALRLWAPLLSDRPMRRARRETGRMRRAFTGLRDLEMLRTEWRRRLRDAPGELRVVLERMIARLDRRIAAASRKTVRRVARRRVARIARTIERALATGDPEVVSAPALADRHVRAMRERALQALEHGFAEGSDEALHAARIRVKKWRYAEECEVALHRQRSSAAVVAELRTLQERLGRAHDLNVAGQACMRHARKTERHAEPAAARTLRKLAATLAREREAAVAEAQRLATTLRRPDPLAARTAD
jgi:CHAD domain-containing protein